MVLINHKSKWLQSIINNAQHVTIYVALGVDSICCFAQMSLILRHYGIEYETIPVGSYADMRTVFSKMNESMDELNDSMENKQSGDDNVQIERRPVHFFINCGAMIDVDSYLSSVEAREVIILDSHRPIALTNISNMNVSIVGSDKDWKDQPRLLELSELQAHFVKNRDENNQQDQETEDDDSEKEELKDFIVEEEEEVEKDETTKLLNEYYHHSYFSYPSSYYLSRTVDLFEDRKAKNDLLWWAIVGLMEHLEFERINNDDFLALMKQFKVQVGEFNVLNQPDPLSMESIPIPDQMHYQNYELNFFMYRHTKSMMDSLKLSLSVLGKFELWKEKGMDDLKWEVACLGVPLEEINQSWDNMKVKCRESIKQGILQLHYKNHKLSECIHSTFVRKYGMDFDISANDFVHCIISLIYQQSSSNNQHWIQNFSTVYKALCGNYKLLSEGIKMSVKIQEKIAWTSMDIIRSKTIFRNRVFDYVRLKGCDEIFFHPIPLTKLCLFLNQIRASKPDPASKGQHLKRPIILSVYNHYIQKDILVGLDPKGSNAFHNYFKKTYEQLELPVDHDGFEACVIQIPSKQVHDFVSCLRYHFENS